MSEYKLLDKLNKAFDNASSAGDITAIRMSSRTLNMLDLEVSRWWFERQERLPDNKERGSMSHYCGNQIVIDVSLPDDCFDFDFRFKYPQCVFAKDKQEGAFN